jgi:hypothetical protein
MAAATIDVVQTSSAIALSQMSEDDRRDFLRLKEAYGPDLLAQALFDDDFTNGTSISIYLLLTL